MKDIMKVTINRMVDIWIDNRLRCISDTDLLTIIHNHKCDYNDPLVMIMMIRVAIVLITIMIMMI